MAAHDACAGLTHGTRDRANCGDLVGGIKRADLGPLRNGAAGRRWRGDCQLAAADIDFKRRPFVRLNMRRRVGRSTPLGGETIARDNTLASVPVAI